MPNQLHPIRPPNTPSTSITTKTEIKPPKLAASFDIVTKKKVYKRDVNSFPKEVTPNKMTNEFRYRKEEKKTCKNMFGKEKNIASFRRSRTTQDDDVTTHSGTVYPAREIFKILG